MQEPPEGRTESRRQSAAPRLGPSFQHRLRHFLHEQRDAIGPLNNVLPNALGQRLVAGDPVDHGSNFALAKPIEGECSDVGSSDPRRVKLGPDT